MVMTAYNIVGESPASAPVEVFVGEAGKQVKHSLNEDEPLGGWNCQANAGHCRLSCHNIHPEQGLTNHRPDLAL